MCSHLMLNNNICTNAELISLSHAQPLNVFHYGVEVIPLLRMGSFFYLILPIVFHNSVCECVFVCLSVELHVTTLTFLNNLYEIYSL